MKRKKNEPTPRTLWQQRHFFPVLSDLLSCLLRKYSNLADSYRYLRERKKKMSDAVNLPKTSLKLEDLSEMIERLQSPPLLCYPLLIWSHQSLTELPEGKFLGKKKKVFQREGSVFEGDFHDWLNSENKSKKSLTGDIFSTITSCGLVKINP